MTSTAGDIGTYPSLAPKILLISTKAYFLPHATTSYLEALLDPSSGILPLHAPSPSSSNPATPPFQIALLPDFLTIDRCGQLLAQHARSAEQTSWPLLLGAQDCFWESLPGPYTGEIAPSSLHFLGCSIVELGHAERRRYLAETNETTAKKAAAVCACGMIPLVCVGEVSAPPKDGPMSMAVGNALREIAPQVTSVLEAVPRDAPVILAYEPVWAIGAEKPAGVEYVGPVVRGIRDVVKNVSGRTGGIRVVYGGSAGPGLWKDGGLGEWVDGMFLGRFAHEISGVKGVVDEVLGSMEPREGGS
jgi:triosephosphate isomerase (TIM)